MQPVAWKEYCEEYWEKELQEFGKHVKVHWLLQYNLNYFCKQRQTSYNQSVNSSQNNPEF